MSNIYRLADYKVGGQQPGARRGSSAEPASSSVEDAGTQRDRLLRSLAGLEEAREAFKRLLPPPAEHNELEKATPVLLFHVSWGRNAWHSTWTARYAPNTIAPSAGAARELISRRLKQGSAFRQTVMPGWHLQFDRRAYLVCEINTDTPFKRLRAARFALPRVTEAEALKMLDPGSELWHGAKPLHDSVIVQQTKLRASEFSAWSDRTSHPSQARTPGRYARKIDGKRWRMSPVNGDGPIAYNTSAFDALIQGIHEVSIASRARNSD